MFKKRQNIQEALESYERLIPKFCIEAGMPEQVILIFHEVHKYKVKRNKLSKEQELAYFTDFFGAVSAQLLMENRLQNIASKNRRILSYTLARAYMEHVWYIVVQLDWTSTYNDIWREMRPVYIPGNPHIAYKDKGWTDDGWTDFLSTNQKICLP